MEESQVDSPKVDKPLGESSATLKADRRKLSHP